MPPPAEKLSGTSTHTPPSMSTISSSSSKCTLTKCEMGTPANSETARTAMADPPCAYAALIFWVLPLMVTMVSRGMETRLTLPDEGSTRASMMTSLRLPESLSRASLPKMRT